MQDEFKVNLKRSADADKQPDNRARGRRGKQQGGRAALSCSVRHNDPLLISSFSGFISFNLLCGCNHRSQLVLSSIRFQRRSTLLSSGTPKSPAAAAAACVTSYFP